MTDVGKNGKQYGLVCPKKNLSLPKATNVFGNDEDSEQEDGTDWVKKALRAEGEKNRAKKQTRVNIQKALEQDPTICQYDEVFEEMKRNEESTKSKKKETKKAKYIDNLLKTAERRKREQEHRIERMVQKEREAEGATYADKESFVTSAYRAKLEEFKKMEKEEENMDRLEAIGDVTKQQDMSGFYRHFFQQTVANDKAPEPGGSEMANTPPADDKPNTQETSGTTSSQSSDDERQTENSRISEKVRGKTKKQSRQYRRHVMEASESESESEVGKADSEGRTEKNRIEEKCYDEGESAPAKKKIKSSDEDKDGKRGNDKNAIGKSMDEAKVSKKENSPTIVAKASNDTDTIEEIVEKKNETKPKVSIWEKRTVGPVFEAALQRYYTRKNMRFSGS